MDDASSHVTVSRQASGVHVVQFARPRKKHAFTADMYQRLAHALRGADEDPDCGAVLVRGDAETFTAGNDLEDFLNEPPADASHPVFALLEALVEVDVPLVAGVCGPAIGIGTTMLLHCDFVVASRTAQFRLPFVDLGLCPEAGSSLLLPRVVGDRIAARMLLLGEGLDADQAERAGLVSEVCDNASTLPQALRIAERVAAKPRAAVRATKQLVRDALRPAVRAAISRENAAFIERLASAEAKAAFATFLRQRKRS
ncbi:MAG: enoyl-CoA hydratase [Myxococcales bacterium FL481]|nr:MAG: enoyl-CoA hydratase [Myxococcales bacterium FL481]